MGNADMFDDLLGGSPDAGQNNLQVALALAAIGIPVFPCREKAETINGKLRKEKSPATKNGFKDATTDASQIRLWWKRRPYALVGMPTGKASGFAVVDLDRHDPSADGVVAMAGLGLSPEKLTNLRTTTVGNGLHLYFRHADGITNKDNHLPKGIDVRAEGGYVIAPGTMFADGRAYGSLDLSKKAPAFPEALMPPPEADYASGETGDKFRLDLTIDEIREYMADYPNDDDMARHKWVGVIASLNHEATAANEDGELRPKSERDAICQIAVDWTAKNPAYNTPEHRKQAAADFRSFKSSAHKNLSTFLSITRVVNNIRMDRKLDEEIESFDEEDVEPQKPVVETGMFDDLLGGENEAPAPKKTRKRKLKWESDDAPEWIQKMNRKHAVIIVGGKANVMSFYSDENDREDHELWDTKTFHDWYLAKGTVPVPAGKDAKGKPKFKDVTMSHAFMGNEYRRGYERGYVFDPKGATGDGFNLFVGWGVEPKKGDCSKILWHVRNVMCDGDDAAYEYFLDYFAHLFQKPWEIPRAAIVIRSGEGAGKDTWAEYIGRIVGRYMPRITGQDQFFGNFNGFLKNALFVNMQEAFVGSQQQNEKLKQYITERTIKVENKYQNAYDTPNLMRLFITSNNFKVVAASESARRFLVLKADERFISNGDEKRDREIKAYFDALYDELNGDGPSALLHYLLNRKLVNFPRIPPATTELSSQVALNWKGLKKFILLAASDGTFDPEDADPLATKEKWVKDGISVEKAHLRQLFNKWCRSQQRRELDEFEPTMTMFTQTMLSHLGAKEIRPRGGAGEAARPRHYHFPKLEFCRDHLSKAARGRLDWGDADEVKRISILPDEEDDL